MAEAPKGFKTPKYFINDIISPACGGDMEIMAAFEAMPRALFVSQGMINRAYEDNALPIGMGQTISQPSTVAHMLKLLELKKTDKVLEIGSGSGFVTALLSRLAASVYAVELIPELMEKSRTLLKSMKITNVKFKVGDGGLGWKDFAPFDKIIASAGASSLPKELGAELAEGGILVIPVKNKLMTYRKKGGELEGVAGVAVTFVDFIGA